MKLIIVESPAKARTIEKFLGADYKVAASYGHVRDLPSSAKEIPEELRKEPWARMGVDTADGFRPLYVITPESSKHVSELKKLLKRADELLLATDEDREGEAISWHLAEILRPDIPVHRITFHEITRGAIEQALAHPRTIDSQLVRAQESRRILDRLYGYSLSPVLWKKVRTKLSAGRVQSVAVLLIVEREEERQAFHTAVHWDVEVTLRSQDLEFTAKLAGVGDRRLAAGKDFDPGTGRLPPESTLVVLDEDGAARIARVSLEQQPWRVARVERKETRQRPGPPLITSTLQQAASARLGMAPQQTMRVAQRLYEGIDLGGGTREGLITYMRTDSLTLSEKALREAAELIRRQFGDSYTSGPRRYRTKSKSAQEAHEAIRPTDIWRRPEDVAAYLDRDELNLYRLIYARTLASQMVDAILDKTTIDFQADIDGVAHLFRSSGSVVRFPGFLAASQTSQRDSVLPPLEEGHTVGRGGGPMPVEITGAEPRRHETAPPARYSEATLIKKLEEEGIGRPSTYAPIISTIQARDYVVKKGGFLLPTYVGMAVTHLMRRHFAQYVDLKFTAKMEQDLDKIAEGTIDWVDFLSSFYGGRPGADNGLLERIAREMPEIEFPAIPIGVDPASGEPVTVRIGRNYVYAQVGEGGDNKRVTLPVDLLIDELTCERVLQLIEARARSQEPIGRDPETGLDVYALIGPYGPYLQLGPTEPGHKPKRVSLGQHTSLQDIDLEQALRLLRLPRDVGVDPETGKAVTAGIGRFGPYVERGRVYARLDSQEQIYEISLEEALARIRNKGKKRLLKELGPHPESGVPLQVLSGRYGPYVTDGTVNAKIANGRDPLAITCEEAVALLAAAAERKPAGRRPGRARKKATGVASTAGKKQRRPATRKKTVRKKTVRKPGASKKASGGSKGSGKVPAGQSAGRVTSSRKS